MAFLELLADDRAFLDVPLGASALVRLQTAPILFTSSVSTVLPDVMDDADEEEDYDTLGNVPYPAAYR